MTRSPRPTKDQNAGASATPSGSRASTEPCSTVSALTGFDPSRENICGALAWIVNQATDGMHTAAGSATTHGDDSGALEMLHRILSDIAINAEMALDAIAMEARQGGDGETRPHPKDDSAGRKASPATQPIQSPPLSQGDE